MPQKRADSLREWGQGRSGRELGWRSVHVSRSPLRVSRVPLPHGHLASSQGALFSPRVEAEVGSCQMWGAHARGCPAQHQSTAPGSFQLLPQPEREGRAILKVSLAQQGPGGKITVHLLPVGWFPVVKGKILVLKSPNFIIQTPNLSRVGSEHPQAVQHPAWCAAAARGGHGTASLPACWNRGEEGAAGAALPGGRGSRGSQNS